MANTTNFNWETPDDTDLVKDGAAAIRTLGSAIDTSLVDLKGGTTGQVLSKATGTDMDFTWVAQDDSNAIQNAIVDAKGDLISATASDTPARLAVGANDTVLTADSSTATGLKWAASATGGMTLLDSGTLSGASTTTAALSGSYKDLYVVVRNVRPATDGAYFVWRYNSDANTRYAYSTGNTGTSTFADTYLGFNPAIDNGASTGLGTIVIPDYANTTTWKNTYWNSSSNNTTTTTSVDFARGSGFYNQTGAITSITFLLVSGNFTSGNYYVYGVK
jgi:hypothetical protein